MSAPEATTPCRHAPDGRALELGGGPLAWEPLKDGLVVEGAGLPLFGADVQPRSGHFNQTILEMGGWTGNPANLGGAPPSPTVWPRIQEIDPGQRIVDSEQPRTMAFGPATNGLGLPADWMVGEIQNTSPSEGPVAEIRPDVAITFVAGGIQTRQLDATRNKNGFFKFLDALSGVLNSVNQFDQRVKNQLGYSLLDQAGSGLGSPSGASAPATGNQGGLELMKRLNNTLEGILANAVDYGTDQVNTQLRNAGVFDQDDRFSIDTPTGILSVKFDRSANQLFNLPARSFDSDLGLSSLGFSIRGAGKAKGYFALNLGVDALSDGKPKLLQIAGESLLKLNAGFDLGNLEGKLGFLELKASPAAGASAALRANADLRLDLDAAGNVKPGFSAGINLAASAELSSKLSTLLPSYKTDISAGLTYDSSVGSFKKEDFTLANAKLNVAGLVRSAKPMLDKVSGVVNEFKPVVDFLTKPLPGLDKAGLKISVIDLAKSPLFTVITGRPPINLAFLEAIPQISAISRGLDQLAGSGDIDLGSISLAGQTLASLRPRSAKFDSLISSAYATNASNIAKGIKTQIQNKFKQSLDSLPKGTASSFSATAGLSGKAYFEFSLLENPS
jgi:hypothetical protein